MTCWDTWQPRDDVSLIEPPPGHPNLVRYSFTINGPRYAEYVRLQAEAALRTEPGAPDGLTIKPLPMLQQLSGQGELWVNQAGLPVRQVLDLEMPEVTEEYGAKIRMSADFTSYGKVETLPRAVPGPNGTWRLEGSLPVETFSGMGAFPGFGERSSQITESGLASQSPTTGLWNHLTALQPLAGQSKFCGSVCHDLLDRALLVVVPAQSTTLLYHPRLGTYPYICVLSAVAFGWGD
jgi:hypothetical protein